MIEIFGCALSGKPSAHLDSKLITWSINLLQTRLCLKFHLITFFLLLKSNALLRKLHKIAKCSPEVNLCKDKGGDEDVSEAGDGDEEDNRNLLKLPTTDLAWKRISSAFLSPWIFIQNYLLLLYGSVLPITATIWSWGGVDFSCNPSFSSIPLIKRLTFTANPSIDILLKTPLLRICQFRSKLTCSSLCVSQTCKLFTQELFRLVILGRGQQVATFFLLHFFTHQPFHAVSQQSLYYNSNCYRICHPFRFYISIGSLVSLVSLVLLVGSFFSSESLILLYSLVWRGSRS